MKTIKVHVSTNRVGSECSDEFEVEDDTTEKEIEEMAKDAMFNMIEWNYDVE